MSASVQVAKARPSASLIVLSPLKKLSSEGYNYRLLLLKRASQNGSFKGHSVFPGGNTDAADSIEQWKKVLPSPLEEEERIIEAKITALRETFEESGILVLPSQSERWEKLSDVNKRDWRTKVISDASNFFNLFEFLSLSPPISSLSHRSNWVTPVTVPRRFDTHFFLTVLPSQSTTTQAQQKRFYMGVALSWHTPPEALRLALERKIELAPPQFYSISELLRYKKWEEAASVIRTVRPIMPVVKKMEGSKLYTILPGDKEYPGEGNGVGTHRNHVQVASGGTFNVLESQRREIGWGDGWDDFKVNDETLKKHSKGKL
ncbi:hypothetical protein BT69DRAFT_1287040 [Atractiella rhizophila]|nr:hypothetical protein BT69DRAFT_1287040 [Atractiella rhizophila]